MHSIPKSLKNWGRGGETKSSNEAANPPSSASQNTTTTLPLRDSPQHALQTGDLSVSSEASPQPLGIKQSEFANSSRLLLISEASAQQNEAMETPSEDQNRAFETALKRLVEGVDPKEREHLLNAYTGLTPEKTIKTIESLDALDSSTTGRRGALRLGPAIKVLEQFMAGVSIGIQQSPEISSLVVGGARLVIDLVVKFVDFYARLSKMICHIGDYLAPLKTYSRNANSGGEVENALTGVYGDLLTFFREARLVFVNKDGSTKKMSTFRTFFRVQWQPFEDKFGELNSSFAHHIDILQHSAQARQLTLLNGLSQSFRTESLEARSERIRVRSKDEIDERRAFLEWISKEDHDQEFDQMIKQRHPGTGIWLLEDDRYLRWINEPNSGLLWCYGNPGAGKSVLASAVIDHLTKYEVQDEKVCVIFAYYSYRDPERDDPKSLVGSLIRQICSKMERLPKNIQNFYRKTLNNAKSPSYDDLIPLFYSLLEGNSNTFIIIDGLDECQAPGSEGNNESLSRRQPKYRKEVLDLIIQLTSQDSPRVKVLATSRREKDIKQAFMQCPIVEIDAISVNVDIEKFVGDEIKTRAELRDLEESLKARIFVTLTGHAQGMFLWASLQLDWICEQDGVEDMQEALSDLPRDLFHTYDNILMRINRKPPKVQEIAIKAFTWVCYAERPIKMVELREAIAIEPSMKEYQDLCSRLRDETMIIDIVGNLLTVQPDGTVRPIHASVQEYLTRPRDERTPPNLAKYFVDQNQAHSQLATTCIAYLSLEIFNGGPANKLFKFLSFCVTNKLAVYASFFFDKHLQHLQPFPPQLKPVLDSFLESDPMVFAAVLQCRGMGGSFKLTLTEIGRRFFGFSSPVNAATMIYSTALYNILHLYFPESKWLSLPPAKYALHQAAFGEIDTALPIIVAWGHDVNEKDKDSMTPLCYAAVKGYSSVAKWLLKNNAEINLAGKESGFPSGTPLDCASDFGQRQMVQLLLENGATTSPQSVVNACRGDCKDDEVVKILIDSGAKVTAEALEEASRFGWYERCQILIRHGVEVTPKAVALAYGALNKNEDIIQLLLENGGVVTGEALENASEWGLYERCKELILRGVKVTPRAVVLACDTNNTNEDVIHLLLDNGGVVTAEVIEVASRSAMYERCKMLLGHCNTITPQAVENSCKGLNHTSDVLKLLLESGGLATSEGLVAANTSYEKCQILLDKGAKVTPEAIRESIGHVNVLRLFLGTGAEVTDELLDYARSKLSLLEFLPFLGRSAPVEPTQHDLDVARPFRICYRLLLKNQAKQKSMEEVAISTDKEEIRGDEVVLGTDSARTSPQERQRSCEHLLNRQDFQGVVLYAENAKPGRLTEDRIEGAWSRWIKYHDSHLVMGAKDATGSQLSGPCQVCYGE